MLSPAVADSRLVNLSTHYRAWLIVLGLSLGPAVSNGFARFAYGLILPAMREDLAWSYTEAGWINTANAIGYLIGALLALALINRVGASRMFNLGMVVLTLAMLGSGLTDDFWLLTLWRVLAGIGGAPVFIAAGALVATLFRDDPVRNALAIALCLAGGGGLGMLLSGVAIPIVLESLSVAGWPQVWLMLGGASAVALLPALWSVSALNAKASGGTASWLNWAEVRPVMLALISYGLFGVGYIVYLTFLVAWMRSNGASVILVAATWAVISAFVMASPFIWRGLLARAHGGAAMALACAISGVAMLLPLIMPGAIGVLISAAMFGGSFFIAPTAATNFSRKNFPAHHWGAAMALFTVVFAVGQMIGPVAAGALADATGSVTPGLAIAGVVLLLSALIGVLQKPVPNQEDN